MFRRQDDLTTLIESESIDSTLHHQHHKADSYHDASTERAQRSALKGVLTGRHLSLHVCVFFQLVIAHFHSSSLSKVSFYEYTFLDLSLTVQRTYHLTPPHIWSLTALMWPGNFNHPLLKPLGFGDATSSVLHCLSIPVCNPDWVSLPVLSSLKPAFSCCQQFVLCGEPSLALARRMEEGSRRVSSWISTTPLQSSGGGTQGGRGIRL